MILLFITQSFKQLILLSSNKLEDTNINTRFGQVHSSVPKWQLSDSIVQEFCFLVEAGCEELVPLSDGGELALVLPRHLNRVNNGARLHHELRHGYLGLGLGLGPPLAPACLSPTATLK